ncbi:glycosyltransferase family 2 protein [Chloroflexota bacterium]
MSESVSAKIIVAMPAYNEEKYIGSLVLLAQQYAGEVIVVDDGSTDRTAKVAALAGATVIQHGANKGYGATIQSILVQAKKRNPDSLVIIDADSQHNPDEIPSLIKAVSEGFDLVIGSRKLQVSSHIPLLRRFGQKVILFFTNILSKRRLSDTESGFRAFSRKAVAELELKEKGMAVSAETVSAATAKGLRVTEVPISVRYTKDGSTMNPVRHGLGVLNRVMVMISERRPLLFFGLFGSILILFGIVAGVTVVQTVFASQVLQTGTALISMLLISVGVLSISTGVILNVLIRRISKSL